MNKDEAKSFLRTLIREMNEQDNAITATPYIVQIRDVKEVAAYPGNGERKWGNSDGFACADGVNAITEYLTDNHPDKLAEYREGISPGRTLFDFECEEIMNDLGYWDIHVDEEDVLTGCFLTTKACQTHIDQNRHHYSKKAHPFITHVWRNPEFEKLLEAVSSLAEIEYIKR